MTNRKIFNSIHQYDIKPMINIYDLIIKFKGLEVSSTKVEGESVTGLKSKTQVNGGCFPTNSRVLFC